MNVVIQIIGHHVTQRFASSKGVRIKKTQLHPLLTETSNRCAHSELVKVETSDPAAPTTGVMSRCANRSDVLRGNGWLCSHHQNILERPRTVTPDPDWFEKSIVDHDARMIKKALTEAPDSIVRLCDTRPFRRQWIKEHTSPTVH